MDHTSLGQQETSGSSGLCTVLSEQIPPEKLPNFEFAVTPADALETTFRHSGWARSRVRVFDVLKRTASAATLDRFANCGSAAVVEFSKSAEKYRIRANYCHNRWCVPCGRARATLVHTALRQAIRPSARVRMITLTLRSVVGVPLQVQIDRLRQHFDTLRHSSLWKKNITAAMKSFEVKRAKNSGGWHPHLHILCEGNFIPQAELARKWWEITADSSNVHICSCGTAEELDNKLAYMCKYAVKPAPAEIYDNADDLAEMMIALKGVRQFEFLGTWRGVKGKAEKALRANDPHDWQRVDYLSSIINGMRAGHPTATRIVAMICKGEIPEVLAVPPPAPIAPAP